MIGAFELEYLTPSRRRPCSAHGVGRRFRAGRREGNPVGAGDDFLQILGVFPIAIKFVLAGVEWDLEKENTMKVIVLSAKLGWKK